MVNLIHRRCSKNVVLYHLRNLSNHKSNTPVENNYKISQNVGVNNPISLNKSGLLNQHRNIVQNKNPYREPNSWIHLTEKYQRKVFGRYGSDSGVSPRICFSTKHDKTCVAVADTEKLFSMISIHNDHQDLQMGEIKKREEDIKQKLGKLDQWKQELTLRIAKKEADAYAAKERKERLVEEVRRHFGYKVDPRDERFKEVLEQKEREDKKKQKEAKRQAKEQKLMSKLVGNSI